MFNLKTIRFVMRLILAAFYLAAGILHLKSPAGFISIVPSFVPWPAETVWFTGVCEIASAIGLVIPKLQKAAGIGLAIYAICVFPANINHALNQIDVGALPNSWWYHGPRFLLQPVLVWWALFCAGTITWPAKQQSVKS
jgi:uncharacterized membrane protein